MSVTTADNKPSQPMAVMSHTHGGTGASVSTASGQTEGATDTTKYALVLTATA